MDTSAVPSVSKSELVPNAFIFSTLVSPSPTINVTEFPIERLMPSMKGMLSTLV